MEEFKTEYNTLRKAHRDHSLELQRSNEIVREKSRTREQTLYPKPAEIPNVILLSGPVGSQTHPEEKKLRRDIEEHYDYVAVNEMVWKYLKSWYGADQEITKRLREDLSNPGNLYLDLHDTTYL